MERLRVRRCDVLVLLSVLEQQRRGRRKPDESNRLYGYHVAEPRCTRCTRQGRQEDEAAWLGCLRNEACVRDDQRRRFDTVFDGGELDARRTAETDTDKS